MKPSLRAKRSNPGAAALYVPLDCFASLAMTESAAEHGVTEILFFHLQSRPLERVLPTVLERALARGQKVVVEVSSQERLAALDDHLWAYADDSFLPHVTAAESDAAANPIVLTTQGHNPNGAQVRVCADGIRIPDAMDGYERVVLMFDGDDPAALTAARADWKKARESGCQASYWHQDDSGRWEKKA